MVRPWCVWNTLPVNVEWAGVLPSDPLWRIAHSDASAEERRIARRAA